MARTWMVVAGDEWKLAGRTAFNKGRGTSVRVVVNGGGDEMEDPTSWRMASSTTARV